MEQYIKNLIAVQALKAVGTIGEKALGKIGEGLGEKALKQAGRKLMQLLKRESPNVANAIEVAVQNPELDEQQPENYSDEVLAQKLQEVVNSNEKIAAAVEDLVNAINPQSSIVQNFTKAEKIGNNYQAPVSIGYQKQELNF